MKSKFLTSAFNEKELPYLIIPFNMKNLKKIDIEFGNIKKPYLLSANGK